PPCGAVRAMAAGSRFARVGQAALPTSQDRIPDRDTGAVYRPPAGCRRLPVPWRHESALRSMSPNLSLEACVLSSHSRSPSPQSSLKGRLLPNTAILHISDIGISFKGG